MGNNEVFNPSKNELGVNQYLEIYKLHVNAIIEISNRRVNVNAISSFGLEKI